MGRLTREAIRDYARRSTRASAELEGRVVPDDFVRSEAAETYLAVRSMPAEQLCRKPPCVAPRKCWQFDYCWFYGDPPERDLTTQDPCA